MFQLMEMIRNKAHKAILSSINHAKISRARDTIFVMNGIYRERVAPPKVEARKAYHL